MCVQNGCCTWSLAPREGSLHHRVGNKQPKVQHYLVKPRPSYLIFRHRKYIFCSLWSTLLAVSRYGMTFFPISHGCSVSPEVSVNFEFILCWWMGCRTRLKCQEINLKYSGFLPRCGIQPILQVVVL